MTLYINTTDGHNIEVALKEGDKIIRKNKIKAPYSQSEKLLLEIDGLLKKSKVKLSQIKEIEVENKGGTFTSLRIGVVTANTLAYALNIPVKAGDGSKATREGISVVKPIYNKEPSITTGKK